MGKILRIALKLNFPPNTLANFGLPVVSSSGIYARQATEFRFRDNQSAISIFAAMASDWLLLKFMAH